MLDHTHAPAVVVPFVEWLERAGFELTKYMRHDWLFGNQFAVFERDGIRFEFVVDRGDWTVSMAAPGFSDTYLADSWEAYLDDYPLAGDLSAIDRDIDFFTRRLDEALRAAADDPTCETKMKADGTDWVRRRLGITGYEQRDAEAVRAAMPSRPKTRPLP